MSGPSVLRRQVEQCRWAQSGYFPAMDEVRWAALDDWRERHEAAVAALATAKGPKAEGEAIIALCRVVRSAVVDLRQRSGINWSTSPAIEKPEGDLAYEEARARLDSWQEAFSSTKIGLQGTGARSIAELEPTAEQRGESPELVAAVKQRLRVREDRDRLFQFIAGKLRAERLIGGSIVPQDAAEALAAEGDAEAELLSGAAV